MERMNLTKLLKMQKVLDDRIVEEKGLQGVDLLDKKILALLTELGELANEWRGFKFWSEDQKPRDFVPNPDDVCEACNGNPVFQAGNKITGFCDYCDGVGVHYYNPLLEEYADCLSFILSIGNDLDITDEEAFYFDEFSIAGDVTTRLLVIHNISLGIWGLDHSGMHGGAIINEYKSQVKEMMNLGLIRRS